MKNPMVRAMLADDVKNRTNKDEIIDSDRYVSETKFDGVRMVAVVTDKEVGLFSRECVDYTERFPEIVEAMSKQLPGIYDGEVCYVEDGEIKFTPAQQRAANKSPEEVKELVKKYPCTYFIFDLLEINGKNIEKSPFSERKDNLKLFLKESKHVKYVPYSTDKRGLYKSECERQAEGIMLKNLDAPYERKRSKNILKWKRVEHDEPYVVGYALGDQGKAFGETLGHVVLAKKEGRELVYMGGCGGGFDVKTRIWLKRLLDTLPEGSRENITGWRPGDEPNVQRWVNPLIRVQVEYNTMTKFNRYRFPEARAVMTQDWEHWDWTKIMAVSDKELDDQKEKMGRGDFKNSKKYFYRAPVERLKKILSSRGIDTDKNKEFLITEMANLTLTDGELDYLGIDKKEYKQKNL